MKNKVIAFQLSAENVKDFVIFANKNNLKWVSGKNVLVDDFSDKEKDNLIAIHNNTIGYASSMCWCLSNDIIKCDFDDLEKLYEKL